MNNTEVEVDIDLDGVEFCFQLRPVGPEVLEAGNVVVAAIAQMEQDKQDERVADTNIGAAILDSFSRGEV